MAQRHMAFDVVQRLREVGQLFVQRGHVGHARRFDRKPLRAALEHALVGLAQGTVLFVATLGLQGLQLALHFSGLEHRPHAGNGQSETGGRNQAVGGHERLLQEMNMRSFKHKACRCSPEKTPQGRGF